MWALLPVLVSEFRLCFTFMFVHYTFSSVWVAEWPRFLEIVVRSVGHMFSLCLFYLLYLFISRFGLKS